MNASPDSHTLAGATVPRRALLSALRLATLAAETHSKIPVLSHVALETEGTALRVRACNLDVEFTTLVAATIRTPIAAALPGRLLLRTLAAMQGDEVHLAQDKATTSITCGPTRATLWHQPSQDLPTVAVRPTAPGFSLAAETFASLIGRTAHAVSREETRYYLNGIYLHPHEGDLCAVATDGHRMVVVAAPAHDLPATLEHGVILPRLALPALQALLRGETGGARITLGEKFSLEIATERGTLRCKTIDGTFPNYRSIIPGDDGMQAITLRRDTLARALARLAVAATRTEPGLELSTTPDGLSLSTAIRDEIRIAETVPIAEGGGWPADVMGLRLDYLRDVVRQIGGEIVIGRKPGIFSVILIRDTADHRALYVIMPRRV